MKFKKEHLIDAVLGGVEGVTEHGMTLIDEGEWVSSGKYEYATFIFQFEDKFYRVDDSRCGSYHSEYYHGCEDWNDEVECDEVISVEVVKREWKKV